MRQRILALSAALIVMAASAAAQNKVPPTPKEVAAFRAIQNATTPDARIEAVDKFVTGFADSSLKSLALFMAADAAERKNDIPKALTYAQTALDADPKNFEAMLLISGELARTTRENDLDKVEKLAKADKLAKDAIEAVTGAAKPNTAITDDQWAAYKKDKIAEAHRDMGMAAFADKKYPVAVSEFKLAVDGAATPDPTTMIRLAGAYDAAGQTDEGIAELDKVLAMPNLPANLKPYAQSERARALAAKNKK